MYSIKTRVRFSETTYNGGLSLTALLNLFQDCATLHGADCGLSYKYMTGEGLAWVLLSWQVELRRMPELDEPIEVVTNPYRISGFTGLRNFWLNDESGRQLCLADTVWALIDAHKGKLTHVRPDFGEKYGLGERVPLSWKPGLMRVDPNLAEDAGTILVQPYMLDMNGHVNNVHYVEWLMEGRPDAAGPCRELDIVFKSETLAGEEVRVESVETEPGVFVHRVYSPDGRDHVIARTTAGIDGPG